MLNIDENQLKLLLEKRKKMIEKPKYGGIGDIVSGISLAITIVLSDFSQLTIIKPLYFEIIVWLFACGILLYGIYTVIKNITTFYSVDNLYSEISDIDPSVEHSFNIVVIRDIHGSGKYLVFKSKRWNCWLFPNYHCLDGLFNRVEEEKHLRECLKRDLFILKEFNITYIGNKKSKKFSVGDKVNKKYNFHFFQIEYEELLFHNRNSFRYNGKKYCWKTLDSMYLDKNIVKKNKDVLDYIRQKFDIS